MAGSSPEQSREILTLVVERADRIRNNSFFRSLQSGRKMSIEGDADGRLRVECSPGPEQEALDAMVLHLRCFIQDNERTSFENLSKLIDDEGLSATWKQGFTSIRERLNCYLDTPFQLHLQLGDLTSSTRRWILGLFVYGDLAHYNRAKRDELRQWRSEAILDAITRFYFTEAIIGLAAHIFWLSDLCKKELEHSQS